MVALYCGGGLRPLMLSWSRDLPCIWHALHTSVVCFKNRVARVRVDKGNKPVTYEEAHAPHYLAHRKGWLSLHTGNLDGEDHAAERTVEDVFLRRFMLGTFPGCLADQLILKRRANQVEICALVLRQLPAHKFYFLVGYSETLLSHFYKCPVCTSKLFPQRLCISICRTYIKLFTSSCSLRRTETCENGLK